MVRATEATPRLHHPPRIDTQMDLLDGEVGHTYVISHLDTSDAEVNIFLLRLGCYEGEPITLISKTRRMYTVVIKNSRYTIDSALARAIKI